MGLLGSAAEDSVWVMVGVGRCEKAEGCMPPPERWFELRVVGGWEISWMVPFM